MGGTQIRAAVVLEDGERVTRVARRTPVVEGREAVIAACGEALAEARDAVPADLRAAIVGIGISSPGPIDPWSGIVIETPNMGPDYHDVRLAAALEERLGLPAYLERDTNVAALGEMAFGAARGCDDFLYVTVSTGIGGAIIAGGRIFHGPDGTAGELGHMPVAMDGPRCGCGAIGHLEAHASGTALARMAREVVAAERSPYLAARAVSVGVAALEAKDVADGADAGDAACEGLMDHVRRAFAVACVGFVNGLNPRRIVVGGSIAEHQGERLLAPAREMVAETAFRAPRNRVRIVPAELGGDVGLAGAHPLVTSRLGDPTWRRGRSTQLAAAAD